MMARKLDVAKVSVVIPCFCCSSTIERAVFSIAQQTQLPYEVILVEDCSGDDTLVTLHNIIKKYPKNWIKIIALSANVGAGEARNIGWDTSSSEYIAFLDADDSWHPSKIEIQYGYMRTHMHVGVCGHAHAIWSGEDLAKIPKGLPVIEILKWRILLKNPFVTPSVMLNRKVPARFRLRRRFMEDHLLWLDLHFENVKITRIPNVLTFIHKTQFGEAGLSAQMWKMEWGDVSNYLLLRQGRKIMALTCLMLCFYSFLKFFRRLVLIAVRRTWSKK